MLVISGRQLPDGTIEHKSSIRSTFDAKFRKNGTFIDVEFSRDGKIEWVAIPVREFMDFVQSDDRERTMGLYYDQNADGFFERVRQAEKLKQGK